jgi:ATP-dependent RNA helicase SUPV3L1/SUV3
MKRLRENAMLEAEIGVDGDVFVEGHHVGQLNGFRFTPDGSAEGPDAKAVLAAAHKSLALEFEARAARLHASGNGDFALGSDAVVRWMGDPVARLTDSGELLRPRAVLLADEQLSDQAREVVSARIDRYVGHYIGTVLKPLEDLASAEDIDGLAKGLAFRLTEAMGVLFRRDVAADVKALDQDARGSLRRYGVRFGAYHVFMPALLKPAPAELITLLWSLRNDGFDKPGYGEITGALAAGRTSVVTDPSFEREFYRLAGFRFLGKRAVRIDILERLADIIRPLIQWNAEQGPRPEGAYDGRRFVATPAMLSILGATPDDMEEILKGLGYRPEPVEADVAAAHMASLDAKSATAASSADDSDGKGAEVSAENEGDPEDKAKTAESVPAAAGADVAASGDAPGEESRPKAEAVPSETEAETGADATVAQSDDGADDGAENKADEAEEPKPVLVWRLVARSDGHRGRNRNQERHGFKGGERNGDARKRGGQKGKGGFKGKHDRAAKGGPPRPQRKDKPIDPDSPFAKLAALKEQLTK